MHRVAELFRRRRFAIVRTEIGIVGANIQRRWIITFAFGLIHGFGFSFALRESLQIAGDHLLTSLLAFNLGVEIGQLAVLVILLPVLALLFKHAWAERIADKIISLFIFFFRSRPKISIRRVSLESPQ